MGRRSVRGYVGTGACPAKAIRCAGRAGGFAGEGGRGARRGRLRASGVDVVAGRSGVEMRDLLPALAMLELKGYVTRDVGGAFVRNPAGGKAR